MKLKKLLLLLTACSIFLNTAVMASPLGYLEAYLQLPKQTGLHEQPEASPFTTYNVSCDVTFPDEAYPNYGQIFVNIYGSSTLFFVFDTNKDGYQEAQVTTNLSYLDIFFSWNETTSPPPDKGTALIRCWYDKV